MDHVDRKNDLQNTDFSPLKWDLFFDTKHLLNIDGEFFNVYLKGNSGPLFYLIHGGGYGGLTWACFVEELCSKVNCSILAPDLRDHGDTITKDNTDFSVERQIKDLSNIYWRIYGVYSQPPPLFIIGHSMGGSLSVHLVRSNELPNLIALSVIDVVEGSAMAALGHMGSFLRNRPQQFLSEEQAIHWCMESGMTRNLRSARVSMPSQICVFKNENNEQVYRWRLNLSRTQPFWNGWFKGLSKSFLNCPAAKILILANIDRLDKELLTGQMKGMFQTEILPRVGHACHEDSPDLVAQIFINFIKRYKVVINKAS